MNASQFKELLNVCIFCFFLSTSLTVTMTQTAYSTYWEFYEWNGYERWRFRFQGQQYQQGK